MLTIASIQHRPDGSYRARLRSEKKARLAAVVGVTEAVLMDRKRFQAAVLEQTGKNFRLDGNQASWIGLVQFLLSGKEGCTKEKNCSALCDG
jgi:hypothetical protein